MRTKLNYEGTSLKIWITKVKFLAVLLDKEQHYIILKSFHVFELNQSINQLDNASVIP